MSFIGLCLLLQMGSTATTNRRAPAVTLTGEVSFPESFTWSIIQHGDPVAVPHEVEDKHVRVRVRLDLRISKEGKVLETHAICGPSAFVREAIQSVAGWSFDPQYTNRLGVDSVTTHLTFCWRDGKGGLISDFRTYPVSEADALTLIKSIPDISRQLRQYPHLHVEIDWFPEEFDGIFYLIHVYNFPPGAGMTYTHGWYEVNAWTAEVWETTLDPIKVDVPQARKYRRAILRRNSASKMETARFQGLNPMSTHTSALLKNPCADRPDTQAQRK